MLQQRHILAQSESLGNLTRCPHGCFHLRIGRMSLSLSEREYIELVSMLNESAANYELLREGWREDGASPYSEDDAANSDAQAS